MDDLRATERSQWEALTLHNIAKPLTTIPSVNETTALQAVIQDLEAQKLNRITVLTPADAVAGTIDRGDIVRAIAQKLNIRLPARTTATGNRRGC